MPWDGMFESIGLYITFRFISLKSTNNVSLYMTNNQNNAFISRLALSIANFAIGATNFNLAKLF